jgi:prepilin-type N-terminal cleavage/methylation domain-containing protein
MQPAVRTRPAAFTLAEVMVSIAVLAIALLGVMGSIAYGTRHSRSGEELTEAVQQARQLLVRLQETSALDTTDLGEPWPKDDSGLNDRPGVRRELDASPLGGSGIPLPQLERYKRRIVSRRLSNDPGDHRYQLAQVTVEVFWESKQGERRLELTGLVSHARP